MPLSRKKKIPNRPRFFPGKAFPPRSQIPWGQKCSAPTLNSLHSQFLRVFPYFPLDKNQELGKFKRNCPEFAFLFFYFIGNLDRGIHAVPKFSKKTPQKSPKTRIHWVLIPFRKFPMTSSHKAQESLSFLQLNS